MQRQHLTYSLIHPASNLLAPLPLLGVAHGSEQLASGELFTAMGHSKQGTVDLLCRVFRYDEGVLPQLDSTFVESTLGSTQMLNIYYTILSLLQC